MKRREFLKRSGTGVAGLTLTVHAVGGTIEAVGGGEVTAGASGRNSIKSHLLKIHLSQEDVIDQASYCAFAQAAEAIYFDGALAASFSNSPEAFFESLGYPGITLDPEAREYKFMVCLGDPLVRATAEKGDAVAFIQLLQTRGIVLGEGDPVKMPALAMVFAVLLIAVVAILVVYVIAVWVMYVAQLTMLLRPLPDGAPTEMVQLAESLGGVSFKEDVVAEMTRKQFDLLIAAIQDGTLAWPDNVSKEKAVREIEKVFQKHIIGKKSIL